MNTKVITVLLIVCITIIACAVYITVLSNNKETNNIIENPLEGIVLEIKENTITNTGLTLMIKNVAPNSYYHGSSYQVEKNVGNNWEPVPDIPDGNCVWSDEFRWVKGNSIKEEEINWGGLYGELSPGNYRIVKGFAYFADDGINGEYYPISCEFTIDLSIRGLTY